MFVSVFVTPFYCGCKGKTTGTQLRHFEGPKKHEPPIWNRVKLGEVGSRWILVSALAGRKQMDVLWGSPKICVVVMF